MHSFTRVVVGNEKDWVKKDRIREMSGLVEISKKVEE